MRTTQENWQQVKKIFNDAMRQTPEARSSFLEGVCDGDESLRREVESLLEAFDKEFMEQPAIVEVADQLIEKNVENITTKLLLENETKVLSENETSDEPLFETSSNRLKWAFVSLFYVFIGGAIVINLFQVFAVKSIKAGGAVNLVNNRVVFLSVLPESSDLLNVGDEIVGFNGLPIDKTNFSKLYMPLGVGEQYTLQIRREGETQLREVVLMTRPLPFVRVLNQYLLGLFLPAIFFAFGLAIFLLKPNDKQALLTALLFAAGSVLVMSKTANLELPVVFAFWRQAALNIVIFFLPFLLHLFLIFPKRSQILRRFPKLEWLIYLPALPVFIWLLFQQLSVAGWAQFDFAFEMANDPNSFSTTIIFFYPVLSQTFYLFTTLAMLFFNYRKADETDKRRIRLLVLGFTIGLVPLILSVIVGIPIGVIFGVDWLNFLGDWKDTAFWMPCILLPIAFGYAVVRHKVIPVSFVIRRGLQYVFAKNALRLLLILPIAGIFWNIFFNPNRTVYEIFFNNSFAFYLYIALAISFFLLIRLRLGEWIDRKFFREQYNQERLLRELTEAVKEADSLLKLSRLVSSKIQTALHPSSVFLFFQEDRRHSDFSLGYSTDEMSVNRKLAADSPLLRLMQNKSGAIEFPIRETDDLPLREKRWLHDINACLLVPMKNLDENLSGIFLLGEKKSEIPYTKRDKELLEMLANQIALVHENLSLKEQMRGEQQIKQEVLSRFEESNINLLRECAVCGRCFERDTLKCSDDNSNLTFTLPVERTIENRYRLEKLIGRGGMGAVYKATDLRINRIVAVKILTSKMFGNRDALRRFEREAQTAGKLNHRNIVTIFDYGVLSTEGAFLVMEFVEGETLSEVLRREGKVDAKTVQMWFGQVLDGLEAAHRSGIIHRDLKPDNILVTHDADENVRLCILDFGLARFSELETTGSVTVPGTIMGTPGYMPPEQLRGERTNERGDLFAVGVIIYECLHGEKPFVGKTYREILQLMEKGIEFDKSEPFAKLFADSLAPHTINRFASANLMKRALQTEA